MELSFEYRCMSCLKVLSTPSSSSGNSVCSSGSVALSCGDFFCSLCCKDIKDTCPSCGVKGIRTMELTNAPKDVLDMFINPAQELQTFFDTLKFQIGHYKILLTRACKVLNLIESERQQLIK